MESREHGAPVGGIVVALLVPVVGVIWAIVLLAQGRGSHGAAVLVSALVGWFAYIALFV